MAVIPFPAGVAAVEAMTLQQVYLGDVTHRSIYTGAQQTLARAPGRWTGSVTIAAVDLEASRRAIEAWLAALRGTVNLTELPLAGRDRTSTVSDPVAFNAATVAAGADAAATAANAVQADGSVWVPVHPGTDRPDAGDYVRIGARLYCVLETSPMIPWIAADYSTMQPGLRLVPGVYPADASPAPVVVRSGVAVRAQLLEDAPVLPMDGDYAGPWSLNWIEQP